MRFCGRKGCGHLAERHQEWVEDGYHAHFEYTGPCCECACEGWKEEKR